MAEPNKEAYVEYTVKELVIALHEKIDKNQDRTNTRLDALEAWRQRAKGAAIVLSILLPFTTLVVGHFL